jgi:hypothetical protein
MKLLAASYWLLAKQPTIRKGKISISFQLSKPKLTARSFEGWVAHPNFHFGFRLRLHDVGAPFPHPSNKIELLGAPVSRGVCARVGEEERQSSCFVFLGAAGSEIFTMLDSR